MHCASSAENQLAKNAALNLQKISFPSVDDSLELYVYYIGNVSLTKQTECLLPQLISDK